MKKTRILVPPLLGLLLIVLWMSAMGEGTPTQAAPLDGAHTAHVAVKFGPNDQIVREISFTAPISGYLALVLTGLDLEDSFGFVTRIEEVGCPANDPYCKNPYYWIYYNWDGNDWVVSPSGAAGTLIGDGAIDGWSFVDTSAWPPPAKLPPGPALVAASDALKWLASKQSAADGSVGNSSISVDALLAIGSNGLEADAWRRQPLSPSLMTYFLLNGDSYVTDGGRAGKLAAGLVSASGCQPWSLEDPLDYYSPTTGAFAAYTANHAWAMLGASALSQTMPLSASQHLKGLQRADGGWDWGLGFGSDTNTTAWAIQALIAGGEPVTSSDVISGLNYLKSCQNDNGGFGYDPASGSDTNSTAVSIQAILAAGQDPVTGTWVISATNPISYLLSVQLPNGSFPWQPAYGEDIFATAQAIPALMGRYFPLKVADLPLCPVAFLPIVRR
ncbi:MAG: hypothetical protein JXA78_01820 [Anaerolineales bacterium]|nr:hypothetical protein [Anaerolineales bacterium]